MLGASRSSGITTTVPAASTRPRSRTADAVRELLPLRRDDAQPVRALQPVERRDARTGDEPVQQAAGASFMLVPCVV